MNTVPHAPSPSRRPPELSLILPVLNEAAFIESVVQRIVGLLEAERIDYQIVLVENGSTDGTVDVLSWLSAQNRRICMGIAPRRGWGEAILTGYQLATGSYLAHMPSDGQIDARIIPALLAVIRQGAADIVKVKRVRRENWLRLIVSKTYNTLAYLMFRTRLEDVNGCPKVYRASLIRQIPLTARDSFLDLEMMVWAQRLGLRVTEVPTDGLPRLAGRGNTNVLTVLEFLRNMAAFRLRLWIGIS